jgi:KaiC/GvpD/RAD55 family RecA-like ATPase
VPIDCHVPIFSEIVPRGFRHGANYLVEFEPDSLWYETSLTIAVQALKAGVRTRYYTFMHIPVEVRGALQTLGADLKKMEKEDKFRLIDSYTSLTGLPIQPEPGTWGAGRLPTSLNDPSYLEKTAANIVTVIKEGVPETDKKWLRIDDNTSIFNRYFKEQDVLNIFQTHIFQLTRLLDVSAFHSVVAGVWSDSFYKQFETQSDGVIDFKTEEEEGQLENYVRVRSIRGKSCDSRWRHLHLSATGEVILDNLNEGKKKEIGISGWLKGPKKNRTVD